MYKDKEKRKQADRERARRYRQRQKGVTETEGVTPKGVTNSGCDGQGVTQPPNTIAEQVERPLDEPIGPLDIYSEERWSRLQANGYRVPDVVDLPSYGNLPAETVAASYDGQLNLEGEIPEGARLGYARKVVGPGPTYQFAVPVPGDPAYEGVCVV